MAERSLGISIVMLAAASAMVGGCSTNRSVIGAWIAPPTAEVETLELTAVSPAATTGNLIVKLTNPNDTPLPLPLARYTVTLGETTYRTDTVPNAALPALGEQRVVVPVVFDGPAGKAYTASGAITYVPPGEIRVLMTDLGIPLPTVSFRGSGEATGQPTTVAVEPVEPIDPQPRDDSVEQIIETTTEPTDATDAGEPVDDEMSELDDDPTDPTERTTDETEPSDAVIIE